MAKNKYIMLINNKNNLIISIITFLLTLDGKTALVVISLEDVDDTVVVVVVVVILCALNTLSELGINELCDMVLLLTPVKSGTREDGGGSCEFLPYSTYYNNKM